jgi:predicted ATPase
LALVIDDAHWADADSLRWPDYLTRRVDALPLLVLLAVRSGEPAVDCSLLETLAAEPGVERLALQRLSAEATTRMVRRALGRDADVGFCRACHAATGGNPFYLGELVRMTRDERLEPTAENTVRVRQLAPATIARAILLRIGRLGKDAVALARAVAVLGPGAELRHAAGLAGLNADAAPEAVSRWPPSA